MIGDPVQRVGEALVVRFTKGLAVELAALGPEGRVEVEEDRCASRGGHGPASRGEFHGVLRVRNLIRSPVPRTPASRDQAFGGNRHSSEYSLAWAPPMGPAHHAATR